MALYLVVTDHGPFDGTYFLDSRQEEKELAVRPFIKFALPGFFRALGDYRVSEKTDRRIGEPEGVGCGRPGSVDRVQDGAESEKETGVRIPY